MLINTVILFLQNALPIFVITTLLLISFSTKELALISIKWIISGVIFTAVTTFILSNNLENISQTFDGMGVELFLSFGYLLIYLFSIFLFVFNDKHYTKQLGFLVLYIITAINGSHFIIYLANYWTQAQQVESMVLGIILGGGICLSISILLYFLLKSADHNLYFQTSKYFLLLFSLGQLMHAIVLLQQVDILSSSRPLWDSSRLITEDSEVGQLLTVLFGYESTPSLLQVIIYIIAFSIPVMICKLTTIRLYIRGEKSC
ncbi:hypothetical protein L3081_13200 [Colwellia sp. MSW7]|uniref:Iron permease n=1 Tax=Colwellia maritima TaxID=2912588 RepID=A0ABS9X1T3_9GAMM|nr:hypothetical protein [Colwellia maritima]MCI2284161.1 hypothetical protein [Colwellia maritima]